MNIIEVKAKCLNIEKARKIALENGFTLFGIDNQKDTYFDVNNGILKIRDAKIEKTMIYYNRKIIGDKKKSIIETYNSSDQEKLKRILIEAIGIKGVVEKKREIYTLKNKIIHLDTVTNLGSFIEIEIDGEKDEQNIKDCDCLTVLFGITKEDLINKSYFEMVMGYKLEDE